MTPYKGRYRNTSARGYREYWYQGRLIKEDHKGLDAVGVDSKRQRAIWDCTKVEVKEGYNSGRGKLVILYFSDVLRVLYQHCASFFVTAQSRVRQGDDVSLEGGTGQVTGDHLHIEPQVLVNGVWVPVSGAVLEQMTEMPNRVTPAGQYELGNDNLDSTPALPDVPEVEAPADGKVYVPRITIAKSGALELFSAPHVDAVIREGGAGAVNGTRRIAAGNYVALEKVTLAGMPAHENATGYKLLVGGEKLYVATGLAFADVRMRSMEAMVKEFGEVG